MNSGRILFAQLLDFFPKREFDKCVCKYIGNNRIRQFSCFDQFLCMAFAQLTGRESLRDIETCLRTMGPKLYHAGFRGKIARSTLADANESRDWKIYAELGGGVDSNGAGIVRERRLRGATARVGLRARLHHHRPLSQFVSVGAVSAAQSRGENPYLARPARQYSCDYSGVRRQNARCESACHVGVGSRGPSTCSDRAYIDYAQFQRITEAGAFFITRAKKNFAARRLYSQAVDKATGVRCDQTMMLSGAVASRDYPGRLRRIVYVDLATGKRLEFLTNHFLLPALTIARLYQCRWQVELFFKWIKQHLRIKAFFGTSENAVKTQIWIAISVYVLVAIVKKRLKLEASLYTILQILSVALFEKTPHFTGIIATRLYKRKRGFW